MQHPVKVEIEYSEISLASTQSNESIIHVAATSDWEKVGAGDLKWSVEKALNKKKYLLIWDQVGTCPLYFSSMEVLNETGLLKEKVKEKQIKHSEMLEMLRHDTLRAMIGGRSSCVVLNLAD
jgi:hypothetical protein